MKSYAELVITSENVISPNIIEALGIEPDESWLKGDLRKGTIIKESNNGYIYKSNLEIESDFEEHIENLRIIFNGKEEMVRSLKENDGCDIQLSLISYYDDPPAIAFDHKVVNWVHSLGASIDVDLYNVSDY